MLQDKIKQLIEKTMIELPKDVIDALELAYRKETHKIGKIQLETILKNIEVARKDRLPMCQDTGVPIFFIEYGKDRTYTLDELIDSINEAVLDIHKEVLVRPSLVDTLSRKNLGYSDNPAWIHIDYSDSGETKIHFLPKGAGSENVSFTEMLNPTVSEDEIVDIITEAIMRAGGKSCPPIILGIGLGGTLDLAALSAKKALLNKISTEKTDLEMKILNSINDLRLGPMGLGGVTTCLDVVVNILPSHTASLPLAVNVQCWCARRGTLIISDGEVYERD